ncbi:hypothetical protein GDO81_026148 [Engystomops pustulosus]|uniref:Uncharacterized protein n=1 Tax=Engystomops pustulosus TaxID=76066 RepID=A0AAV6YMW5_ENGPU|nr:hypothetical protein GDO81_026148 [Engystomops pustulosus]
MCRQMREARPGATHKQCQPGRRRRRRRRRDTAAAAAAGEEESLGWSCRQPPVTDAAGGRAPLLSHITTQHPKPPHPKYIIPNTRSNPCTLSMGDVNPPLKTTQV